jgi:transcriptional regulator GlxA family with amidase domain
VARESSDVTVVHDRRLAQAIGFLKKHLRRAMSLDQVAEAGGVSRRTLYHLFREELATTPADYLRRERTLLAQRLLREQPGLTLQEAARRSGFSCTRTLTRNLQGGH